MREIDHESHSGWGVLHFTVEYVLVNVVYQLCSRLSLSVCLYLCLYLSLSYVSLSVCAARPCGASGNWL